MYYLESDILDAHWNLALEYYLATEKKLQDTVVYLWRTSPTVVIGRFQNALEELDRKYTEEKGICIARRMSGGGTIYNDEGGLMFTYIVPEAKQEIDFRSFIDPVIAALGKMGVSAEASGRRRREVRACPRCGADRPWPRLSPTARLSPPLSRHART